MDVSPRRHRSSRTSAASPEQDKQITCDLQALISAITESLPFPPSLSSIQLQCDDLRRIRQLLIDHPLPTEARDAFRRIGGFTTLLDLLRSLNGFYTPQLTRDQRTGFFELLKTALDVLSESLDAHPGNRRYFANRVPGGGWKSLEQALKDTGFGAVHSGEDNGGEQFFGTLLAFAVAEESVGSIFRGIHKLSKSRSSSTSEEDPVWLVPLRDHLRSTFSGHEILRNPEIVPIVFNFWRLLAEDTQEEHRIMLSTAVALAVKQIADLSVRNQIALHNNQGVSILLSVLFDSESTSPAQRVWYDLAVSLISYGINKLDDAWLLFRRASTSDRASEFLLQAMQGSSNPAFIQLDLSLHGYSSIELPSLGRAFPPTSSSSGYTMAAWIRIDKFDPDVHTTIFGAYDSSQSCFILAYLENDTRHLILQTSMKLAKPSVRFRSVTFKEGVWYHIAIVHRRPKTTSSSRAMLFVDGMFEEQIKCPYPASAPLQPGSTDSFASLASNTNKHTAPVQAFLGTPQDLALRLGRGVVTTKWSLGSFHLFQEALSDQLITVFQKLGPRYSGNFQDCLGSFQTYRASAELNQHNELLHPGQEENSEIVSAIRQKASLLLGENQLLLSFSPSAVMDNDDTNNINEAKLAKSLSKEARRNMQRVIRAGGNSIIINAAVPSLNEALTQPHGVAILTGDPVVSVPQSLDDACWRLAGSAAACLKLVELARTKDAVLRATKILFQSVESSWRNSEAMERENGFQVLAGLLREKLGFGSILGDAGNRKPYCAPVDPSEREELALELLRAVLQFVGYDEKNPEGSIIINPLAYRVLLVDFDTWRKSPMATQKLYYSQFVHFTVRSRNQKFNSRRLIRMRSVKRLLDALKGELFSIDVFPDFMEAFISLLKCNISGDNLRSLALFVTYALHDSRAFPGRSRSHKSNVRSASVASKPKSEASTPYSASPGTDGKAAADMPKYEVGVKILEMYTDIICDPSNAEPMNKFAKTVTNKWILYLLDEHDPRVVFLATKLLARLLIAHGPHYVKKFSEKSGGFVIMKQRLKSWWNMPALWTICFAILFGQDVGHINFDEDFNHFTLAEIFSRKSVQVVYPEAFQVITSMLEYGLRAIVDNNEPPENGTYLDPNQVEGRTGGVRERSMSLHTDRDTRAVERTPIQRIASDAEVLNTVIRFLADLHMKWGSFRDFAATSDYVQGLLFVLYPVIVTSDNVSAETELHSRGSALTFEGQDVVIRPHTTAENHRPPIVRTTAVEGPPPSPTTARAIPFRRASSFILITSDRSEADPIPARFSSIMSPTSSGPVSLRVGNAIVEGLLEVIVNVFLDQVLHRKEFAGFGLFLKVPPGFQEHQVYFESYVLSHTMTTLANNIRLNQKVLCEPRVLTNVARYTAFMAEAIFEGWFLNGAEPLLDFTGHVLEYLQRPEIAALRSVRLCSSSIASMRTVFLRVSLLRLSELDPKSNEKATTAFLDRMMYWQTVILSTDHNEHYFLRLIFYLLYIKIVSRSEPVRLAAVNFWRMLLVQKPEEASHVLTHAAPAHQKQISNTFMELAALDNEAFLQWVDRQLDQLDSIFLGALAKHWEDFIEKENERTEETARNRVAKRREKLKAWNEVEVLTQEIWRRHESATSHWRNNVYSAERLKHQRTLQDQQDNLQFTAATLNKLDRILKGPCGLYEEDPEPKWRLDETEGKQRMRLRIIQDSITQQDDYQPKRRTTDAPRTLKVETNIKVVSAKDILVDTPSHDAAPMFLEPGRQRSVSQSSAASGFREDEYEIIEDPREDEDGFEDKNRKVMRTLQPGDVIQNVCNVSRIIGLEACEGLLIIGKECLYLLDNYFQRADGEVVGVWQAPPEERDPYLQMIMGQDTKRRKPRLSPSEQTSRNWRWSEVMLVSKRRFLFRDVALEIFFTDGRSYLLTTISPHARNDLYTRLMARAPFLNNPSSIHSEDVWRLESLRNPEEAPQSFGSKFANVFASLSANPATRKWVKGEMSNFAYLMLINTMAGRTFNDLTQYPVFPWVLADYTSEELDLSDPRTFRDLSKPMGCQVPAREAEFRERFQIFSDLAEDGAPPFHYGTHYSSAMIVASYLIRLQPFVQSYLLLQGGSFDHADRLFYSIEKAWLSASRDNMGDVRELTPEFFYLPEFLTNINGYNFGQRQGSGEQIGDVQLPPWAKGDPAIFIAKHREALESPFVSQNLHKWIDLVFGYKQRGEAAVDATNVFHHLSYHGAKDLDTIVDPVELHASIGIIHNFGQTPHQVFQRAHPQREETSHRFRGLDSNVDTLARVPNTILETPDRVAHLVWSAKHDRVLASSPFRIFVPPHYDRVLELGFADASVRFSTPDSRRPLALYEHLHLGHARAAVFVDGRTLVTGGRDGVVTVWNVEQAGKTVEVQQRTSLFGHRRALTCLAVSKPFAALLSADEGGRVLMWDLNRSEYVREVIASGAEVRAARISNATGEMVLCAGREVCVYSLNGALRVRVNVCDPGREDEVLCCAWYEGVKEEWLERNLLVTGHRSGVVKIWHKAVTKEGPWKLQLVRRLEDGGIGPVTSVLAVPGGVFAGDDNGRVYEWPVSRD
ncbi:beach-domain-containing protein [Trichodelitschia bisporula]|uniref:Beach-domain-containing protein n=1 Tax=Trichodelitschia bisporula TaxID=703511 RepID=A0A6G1HQ18_9PEZI|nr:beach-domain-containing protein [Trichodelitschia bisporula]